ncbi:uncharacterized protein LOC135694382 [Rhopilema esculentum]|uniref:uncharacterized protein LOC135694382 n=1 Tax=Rhopilema esculentum TaxID=499914 RepID=UPI0031CF0BCE|eukprot:gene4356-20576_t
MSQAFFTLLLFLCISIQNVSGGRLMVEVNGKNSTLGKRWLEIQDKIWRELGKDPIQKSLRTAKLLKLTEINSIYRQVRDEMETNEDIVFIANIGKHEMIGKTILRFKVPAKYFENENKVKWAALCLPRRFAATTIPGCLTVSSGKFIRRRTTFNVQRTYNNEKGWPCYNMIKAFHQKFPIDGTLLQRLHLRHAFLKLTLQQSTPNMQKDILPVLHIQAIRKPRRKRGIDCGTGSQRRCCRAPLKISFKDIGYANIILAPASFDAYVCTGQCGTFSRHTSTRVNVVKDYNSFRNRNEKSGLVKFCCTATKTSALTVLLKDGKFVFSKKISGMVIEECSCN